MSSSKPPGSTAREAEVSNAIQENDLSKLQELSLLPGGFRNARGQAWPFLLGVDVTVNETMASSMTDLGHRDRESSLSDSWTQPSRSSAPTSPQTSPIDLQDSSLHESHSRISSDGTDVTPHPDEHQVQLDTNRSFILYPVENRSTSHRKLLQEDLHDIILGVLRKRPKLRYFQGYHDIITVLFLTLPLEAVLPSAEKLSLHRLRDSMGSGLEPLVGQLRILKRLLRIVDPSYAEILERNSPLPYYALSNLLTLFAHDVPTLPLIQHVFDWLLCREPVAAIWLAAAVILSRKEDVLALEREGDEAMGMMHAVLSALPLLSENEATARDPHAASAQLQSSNHIEAPRLESDFLVEIEDEKEGGESTNTSSVPPDVTAETVEEEQTKRTPIIESPDKELEDQETIEEKVSTRSDSLLDSWTTESARASSPIVASPVEPRSGTDCEDALRRMAGGETDAAKSETHRETEAARSRTRSYSSSRSRSHSRSPPGGYKEKPVTPPLPLYSLLCRATDLLAAYPPSSPALRLAETFGSQSALRTCDPSTASAPFSSDDEEAEACVGGDNVVLPLSQEEQDEEFGPPRKAKAVDRAASKRKRRTGGPIRLANGMVVRRQTIVAGVVLLLGVAVALYGFGPGGRGAGRNGHGYGRFGNGQMKWVAAWVGGLLGVGERLGIGF